MNAPGTWVEESLLNRLHTAPIFSIMADECTDATTIGTWKFVVVGWRVSGVPEEHFIEILLLKKANAGSISRVL